MSKSALNSILISLLLISVTWAQNEVNSDESEEVSEGSGAEQRIVGGNVAKPHSIPYTALIYVKAVKVSLPCGGTIVNPKTVITAASCLASNKMWDYLVFAGVHNKTLAVYNPPPEVQLRHVAKVFRHPEFKKFTEDLFYQNNVGIIILRDPLEFNEFVKAVKLPAQGHKFAKHSKAKVSGFGVTKIEKFEPKLPSVLHVAEIKTLSDTRCKRFVRRAKEKKGVYNKNVLCAGDAKNGLCWMDTGGPLTIGGVLAGISNVPLDLLSCTKYPSTFTKAANFIDWLNKTQASGSSTKNIFSGGLIAKQFLFLALFANLQKF